VHLIVSGEVPRLKPVVKRGGYDLSCPLLTWICGFQQRSIWIPADEVRDVSRGEAD